MTRNQYNQATNLLEQIRSLEDDLAKWNNGLSDKTKLAMRKSSSHDLILSENIPDAVFTTFRNGIIANIQTKINNLEAEFTAL